MRRVISAVESTVPARLESHMSSESFIARARWHVTSSGARFVLTPLSLQVQNVVASLWASRV